MVLAETFLKAIHLCLKTSKLFISFSEAEEVVNNFSKCFVLLKSYKKALYMN